MFLLLPESHAIYPKAAGTSLLENCAQQLVLIPSEMEIGLAEAIIKDIICNRWE